jgi:response regulator RpfG family c-di-GMP phosphodiesterase
MRILLVDDDPALRALLRTTFEAVDVDLEEADDGASAARAIERRRPDVVVLDVGLPGIDGLDLCRRVKLDPATREIGIVLLTGLGEDMKALGEEAGADAFLAKPFSPLELLALVERVTGGFGGTISRAPHEGGLDEQLELYARDLRHLLEVERGQRLLLERAYQETVTALASALESKDTGTRAHSNRVQRYAVELARAARAEIADDPSARFGFLLHDVGKIGIPDRVLLKPGPLTPEEQRLMKTHTILGEQVIGGVAFLQGEGRLVVRHHHERWDGAGYPDRLAGTEIPIGARVFAVADTLDAMTTERPYRPAGDWDQAGEEIVEQAGRQFDPKIVSAFRDSEPRLREIHQRFLKP